MRNKKAYIKPVLESETFIANKYIAACQQLDTWRVNCNVPNGTGYYETNDIPGYQEGNWSTRGDEKIASGTGCYVWHTGVNTTPVANAMWQEKKSGRFYPVFHWSTGRWNTDQHFSKVEDAEWEHEKNLS